MEMPPEDTDTDQGEDDEEEVDDGAGAGPMPDLEDDMSIPAEDEGHGGDGDHCAASEDMLAGGLGGQDGDGLRSDFEHYMATNSEGNIYVDRVYEIERTVRNELHAVRGATAREIARRLLARQGVMMDIMFHLQRALDLALRICPASSDGRPPVGALAGETAIWRKITGLYPDVRHVTELGAAMEAHLRRREQALREAEEEFQRWRAAQAGAGTGGGRPLHPAKARPHPPGLGRHEVDRSRSPNTRPRPSVAPHLVARPDVRPPCLRPWWERSVAELAETSARPIGHSPDPPRPSGAVHAEHDRGAVGAGAGVVGPATTHTESLPGVGEGAGGAAMGDVDAAGGDLGELSLSSSVPAAVHRRRAGGSVRGDSDGGGDPDGEDAGSEDGEDLEI